MDIRCPSCSTLYEFDSERVGAKGVNVRCSACGQVFKVRIAAPDEPKILWMVKRDSTGEVINFDELSTLQRWIIEQKVSRRDLISKTGDTWKALGSINELQAFFKVVDELNVPRNSSRDTDGYLTAEQRTPGADDVTPDIPPASVRSSSTPAARSGGAETHLMPGVHPPDLPSAYARGAATRSTAPPDLPDVRPARQSAPVPVALADDPSEQTGPIRTRGGADAWSLGGAGGPKTETYSLGDHGAAGADGPAITFGSPPLDAGRSADYTAEYAALRRQRSRWPTVLLALLLLAAGVLIVLAAVKPEVLGLNSATDTPLASGVVPGTPGQALVLADIGVDGVEASEGSGATVADAGLEAAQVDGSGDSGDANADVAPTPAAEVAAAAPEPAPSRAEAPARRDRQPEPPPQRAEPERSAAEPAPAREEPRREDPPAREAPSSPAPSGDYDGLMGSGNEALRSGNPQQALNHFSAATDARPNSAEAHVGVARAYDAMGRYDLAAVRYERASSVNSRYTPAWLGLGDARRRNGDARGACQAYERVLAIVRTGSSAERAIQASEDLGCD